MDVIEGVNTRIAEFQTPAGRPVPAGDVQSLPRISAPLKDENVFAASPPPKDATLDAIGQFVKSHGQNKSEDGLTPRARRLIGHATSTYLSPEQQQAVSADNLKDTFHQCALEVIKWPIGKPFRKAFRLRLLAVVLGTPYGDGGIIVDAIESLTRLAILSLSEDTYGRVQTDVPKMIRAFTATTTNLDAFVKGFTPHWTDYNWEKNIGEVDDILANLRRGLAELVENFGPFSDDLRLTRMEMRLAREACVENVKEMSQKRIRQFLN